MGEGAHQGVTGEEGVGGRLCVGVREWGHGGCDQKRGDNFMGFRNMGGMGVGLLGWCS